ncbi:MAG: 4Fe-4S dicluster domain-containing protein [Planctomycetes bacterium]|nr:4Fe-4S dicluster domain-containing protein [Planctomycetota bacterium]
MSPIFMALLLISGWGIFAYSAYRRWNLMMIGAPEDRSDRGFERIRVTIDDGLKQLRMRRYPLAGAAHMMIFAGFMVLLPRTLILWGRGFDGDFDLFWLGSDHVVGRVYGLAKDVFAVLVIIGTLVFLYFRLVRRLERLTQNIEALVILFIILAMMVADVVYDGASMVQMTRAEGAALAFHGWEPVGSVAQYCVNVLPDGGVTFVRHLGFWTHSALVLIFLNLLPYSKHLHVITGIPNIYTQNLKSPGRLAPLIDIEGKIEREETLGIKRIDQFSWKSILDFYTCTECGRCSDFCPATNTGKKLSPKHFTIDLRNFLYKNETALVADKARAGAGGNGDATGQGEDASSKTGDDGNPPEHRKDLVDGVIDPEVLWACTTCRACEQECPVFISYVDKIVDMRRYLVQERGEFPRELETAFRGLETTGNPWSYPADDRANWAEGLDIPTLAEMPDADVIFWSGCMPSFDERAKRVTRATVELMKKAGVKFAILGNEETCTGDPARRAGNEYLFQTFAKQNVETLGKYGADKKKIVTSCPHCFNTLANEYPDFGGHYDVVHHTQLLAELVKSGKLTPTKSIDKRVAYHDSCYLGRHNNEYDAPRAVLEAIPGLTILEPKETRDRGMCCGAGGAQMFKEEEPGDERINERRADQLLETNPDAVASNCPFCMRMLTDGLAAKNKEEVETLDVAELLREAVGD